MKLIKLSTNGDVTLIDYPKRDPNTEWYAKQIGCEWIEIVRPRGFDFVMIIDEEGLLKENKLNPYASYIYGITIHGQPIVGDALIALETSAGELIAMKNDEARKLAEKLQRNFGDIVKAIKESLK